MERNSWLMCSGRYSEPQSNRAAVAGRRPGVPDLLCFRRFRSRVTNVVWEFSSELSANALYLIYATGAFKAMPLGSVRFGFGQASPSSGEARIDGVSNEL